MVYLEKIEANDMEVKYYYFVSKKGKKGILTYYPNTDTKEISEYCENDNEDSYIAKHRGYAFRRMKEYVSKNNYPEKDMVAWG